MRDTMRFFLMGIISLYYIVFAIIAHLNYMRDASLRFYHFGTVIMYLIAVAIVIFVLVRRNMKTLTFVWLIPVLHIAFTLVWGLVVAPAEGIHVVRNCMIDLIPPVFIYVWLFIPLKGGGLWEDFRAKNRQNTNDTSLK